MTLTPKEIIEAGIENIQKYGHTKGAYGSNEEGFCMLGSVRAQQVNLDEYQAAYNLLDATVQASGFTPSSRHAYADCDPIPRFNDDPATTVEDVLLMMKKAAHG